MYLDISYILPHLTDTVCNQEWQLSSYMCVLQHRTRVKIKHKLARVLLRDILHVNCIFQIKCCPLIWAIKIQPLARKTTFYSYLLISYQLGYFVSEYEYWTHRLYKCQTACYWVWKSIHTLSKPLLCPVYHCVLFIVMSC